MTVKVLSPSLTDATDQQRVPVHVWAKHIDRETETQLRLIASQPYVLDPVCAMADAHLSNHVAVGTVFATEHTIVPDALGGDLGCGIAAHSLPMTASMLDLRGKELLLAVLQKRLPVGDQVHRKRDPTERHERFLATSLSTHALTRAVHRLVTRHLCTLGGGNHFIEIARAEDDQLWVLVHSGSRGIGSLIAEHHRAVARAQGHAILGGLDLRSEAGDAYKRDLAYAVAFAQANRALIVECVKECFAQLFSSDLAAMSESSNIEIDIAHNTATIETHLGRECVVHRKGATLAAQGELGIIPGSMGTATYIVEGKGAPQSWCSCSHGAGRVMSRRQAHESISVESLKHSMRKVVFDQQKLKQLVDEAPAAYRDIREVLEQQQDLITPVLRLEPIISLKG